MTTFRIHELKCWPSYFQAIVDGDKPFDARRDDRGFQKGDRVLLREFEPGDLRRPDRYSGRVYEAAISYVLAGGQFGIEAGYCVLGLADGHMHARAEGRVSP